VLPSSQIPQICGRTLQMVKTYVTMTKFGEFHSERMELYFIANNVVDGKKAAVLLSVIGIMTYSLNGTADT